MTFVVIARGSCAEAIQTLPTLDMIRASETLD